MARSAGSWITPCAGVVATAMVVGAVLAPTQTAAQDFFGLFRFFGSASRQRAPAAPRSEPYAYADPSEVPETLRRRPADADAGSASGVGDEPAVRSTYCVRLCDGRFFPLSGPASASTTGATKMCSALCPASHTAVLRGGQIDNATTPRGERYADLANAFVYRDKLVAGCTCNGKDALGLAPIDVAADPTLRPGDVVATAEGLKVFKGGKGATHTAGDFTPVDQSARVSADLRRRLATTRVQTTP